MEILHLSTDGIILHASRVLSPQCFPMLRRSSNLSQYTVLVRKQMGKEKLPGMEEEGINPVKQVYVPSVSNTQILTSSYPSILEDTNRKYMYSFHQMPPKYLSSQPHKNCLPAHSFLILCAHSITAKASTTQKPLHLTSLLHPYAYLFVNTMPKAQSPLLYFLTICHFFSPACQMPYSNL